jgi:hypothetical protein
MNIPNIWHVRFPYVIEYDTPIPHARIFRISMPRNAHVIHVQSCGASIKLYALQSDRGGNTSRTFFAAPSNETLNALGPIRYIGSCFIDVFPDRMLFHVFEDVDEQIAKLPESKIEVEFIPTSKKRSSKKEQRLIEAAKKDE